MLKKLMKHEIRSSARIMLPLFAIVLVLSLCVSLMLRTGFMESNTFLSIIGILFSTGYGIALAAVFIVVLVLMINRFRTNLLGDEGYVMFTLPVSVHQILWSKIIVSCLWFVGACVAVILSVFVITFDSNTFAAFGALLAEIWGRINAYYALNGGAILLESIVLLFFGYTACCLQFYSAMAVGHSFDRRKSFYSILFFFGSQFVLQVIVGVLFSSHLFDNMFLIEASGMAAVHLLFLIAIVLTILYCAIFYCITTHFLQKRLNIE